MILDRSTMMVITSVDDIFLKRRLQVKMLDQTEASRRLQRFVVFLVTCRRHIQALESMVVKSDCDGIEERWSDFLLEDAGHLA